ncbi:MAG: type 1 glutamine amidotransferase domain-containing protein [Candidatus Methanoperedens sp.]|uniref:type 1 glutamine amidotransferase domain-containing protein n=1 Tax=Candidatus Methanoperedens nitratireducens TaxID=1392998 RepID=UPI00064F31B4|nr:type 1 glutamine amidotransferase domain-containing protein [Candidatus Methanoperedens nitroreducens]MDJ1421733.1 type 1 glutamine amidotransferase domain-containing protein [Candidatus Methanoperedens sp.]
MRALMISADNFEDLELFYPLYRLKEEGVTVKVASMREGKITGKHGYPVDVDLTLDEVKPDEFDMLVLPGGRAPEKVRLDKNALEIARFFFHQNKPVGAICHGVQTLISAGVIEGRRATCYIGIRDDLISAGAHYEDKEVVVDGNLITSRDPDDLPAFGRELIKILKK